LIVATYTIGAQVVEVSEQQEEGTGEVFFDLFDNNGDCLNLGDPFWQLPTEEDVRRFLDNTPSANTDN
jgi:hypothetical protein